MQGVRVRLHEALAALLSLHDEPCTFQNRHVLLHRGEGHIVISRQMRDIHRGRQGAANDVASGGIGECSEDPINLAVRKGNEIRAFYNHLVVRYGRCVRESRVYFDDDERAANPHTHSLPVLETLDVAVQLLQRSANGFVSSGHHATKRLPANRPVSRRQIG